MPVEATFALTTVAHTSIGAAYALAVELPRDCAGLVFDNQTDGDVQPATNDSTADIPPLQSNQVISVDLAAMNLHTNASIYLKDGTSAPTSGNFYIWSMRK